MYIRSLICVALIVSSVTGYAQSYRSMKPVRPIVCYGKAADEPAYVAPPEQYLNWRKNDANARTKTATFDVTYVDFTDQAKAAFQQAVDIWSTLITSPVTIHVYAVWKPLGTGVLGSAIWGSVHANFEGAQRLNTWYPVALAEKMAGTDLNDPADIDIYAEFSSTFTWYYGLDGKPTSSTYDLTTVVLHELGHGLGFVDSYFVSEGVGSVGAQDAALPMIYDLNLENLSGQNLFRTFTSGTTAMGSQLTSGAIYFNSPTVLSSNTDMRASIYAPATYSSGSSIAHVDETVYPKGNVNSLMSPQIGRQEAIHNPGPIVLGAFSDMGWVYTYINHKDLKDSENTSGPYVVKATINSENGPASVPQLHYTSGGAETTVTMTATGVTNEYQASIPSTGVATTYGYYISVTDASSREYTRPGKLVSAKADPQQVYTIFKTGPDTEKPSITHTPKTFVVVADGTLDLKAYVTDNLGLEGVSVDYMINDVAKPSMAMVVGSPDSLYTASINVASLANGDQIKYRIKAVDASSAANVAMSPESDYYTVNVVALAPTQESYATTFDDAAADFFSEDFTITTPAGFSDPAMQSPHPYLQGDGQPNNERNYITQLRIPIRVHTQEATVKFDEVVLVEPGETGAEFGSDNFYDYVVVEGSKDGGITWTPLADGYDSRDNSEWLSLYNGAIDGDGNSTATGSSSLYKTRTLNLLNQFAAGDEVVIRFRLYSDQLSTGWGWAIDNLKIQIDETPPTVLHNHVDYKLVSDDQLQLLAKVTDFGGVSTVKIETQLNDQEVQQSELPGAPGVEEFALNIDITALQAGDVIQYRIIAEDGNGNETTLPATGTFKAVIFAPGDVQNDYANDFNSNTTGFIGNFFNVATPDGFADNAIHSSHSYPNGFGLDNTSSYAYMLSTPIRLSADIPYLQYKEIAIVETHTSGAVFGTPDFKDYVVVEGSKDGGVTWLPFIDGYSANDQTAWTSAWKSGSSGTSSMFKTRLINLLDNGNFAAGDEVLFRFRLYANATLNGWGWSIDDLYIQSPVLATETTTISSLKVYPVPARSELNISMEATGGDDVVLTLINAQGKAVLTDHIATQGQEWSTTLDLSAISNGLYMLKIQGQGKQVVKKIIKTGY